MLIAHTTWAQDTQTRLFVAPGEYSQDSSKLQTYEAGGGFERFMVGGLSVSAEASVLAASQTNGARVGIGSTTFDGNYHFLSDRAFDPTISAGYSLLIGHGTVNTLDYGIGFNYWYQDDRGFVLQFRNRKRFDESVASHYWSIEIGVAFR